MDKATFYDRFCRLLNELKEVYDLDSLHDALILWYAQYVLNMDPDDVVDRIFIDAHAEGIDSLLLDEAQNDQIFVSGKTVESFEKTQNNFSENDIKLTLEGVRFLLTGSYRGKITDVLENLVDEFHDNDQKGGYRTRILFLHLKQPPVSKKYVDEFLREYSGRNIEVVFYGFDDLYDFYINRFLIQRASPPEKISFKVLENILEKKTPLESIVFSCKGEDLAEIYETNKERIFQQNVRYSLGVRSKSINKQILETAESNERNGLFWYFNNGITIVCEDIDIVASGRVVHLKKGQIINGAQTTYALHEAYQKGTLKDNVIVLIKAIKATERDFIENVTLYTNSQNAIRVRDLCSNDEVQLHLQNIFRSYKYFFERKRGQFDAEFPTKDAKEKNFGKDFKSRVISNESAAQAYLAMYLDRPVVAKRNKERIFMKDKSGFYFDIFNAKDDLLTEKFLLAWVLHNFVDAEKKTYMKNYKQGIKFGISKRSMLFKYDFLIHSEYFILNIFKDFIINGGYNIETDRGQILDMVDLIIRRRKFIRIIYRNITLEMAKYFIQLKKEPNYYHNKFFKNDASIGLIRNYLRQRYPFIKLI